MRKWAVAVALLLEACSSTSEPTRVTYTLGGIVSGPYRVSADLVAGIASEAAGSGPSGDASGVRPSGLPDTSSRPLSVAELQEVRRLARKVLADGAFHCQGQNDWMMMDALGSFEFETVGGGKPTQTMSPTFCMTNDASMLMKRIRCAAHPGGLDCLP